MVCVWQWVIKLKKHADIHTRTLRLYDLDAKKWTLNQMQTCEGQCHKHTHLDYTTSYTQGSIMIDLSFIQTMPITQRWPIT
jgi:hypothetical protein